MGGGKWRAAEWHLGLHHQRRLSDHGKWEVESGKWEVVSGEQLSGTSGLTISSDLGLHHHL